MGFKKKTEFKIVLALRIILDRIYYSFSPSSLFESKPSIHFNPQIENCPCCSETLNVYKSRTKTVYTLHLGAFIVNETITKCRNQNCRCTHKQKYASQELEKLVPFKCKFGYDVLVYVGKAMFLRHCQGEEILIELAKKNVSVSLNEVYYLAKKFIVYLATLHNIRNDNICEIIQENGGYILHLDSFGDKGSPRIITGLDSISDIVLENAKIASEKSDYIKPFLKEIKKRYGNPLAIVQDMAKGIMNAVEEVFSGVMILICNYHFLRDIGKDFLEENYNVIRKRLRHFGIVSALRSFAKSLKEIIDADSKIVCDFFDILENDKTIDKSTDRIFVINIYMLIIWTLEGKNLGNGYGFPFDRPHYDFTIRLNDAYSYIQSFKQINDDENNFGIKTLLKIEKKIKEIIYDEELQNSVKEISNEIHIFDKLRDAMRIAPDNGNEGLNDKGDVENIKTIEMKVYKFREWFLQCNYFDGNNKKHKSFVAQINKYWDKLFAEPIEVETENGKITIQPQRTNNILEQLFRDFNYGNMRKTGRASKEKNLKAMVANTPLVRNLKNEDYMKAILGKNETLEEAFASINSKLIRDKMEEAKFYPNKVPEKFKKLARMIDFPDKFLKLMKKVA